MAETRERPPLSRPQQRICLSSAQGVNAVEGEALEPCCRRGLTIAPSAQVGPGGDAASRRVAPQVQGSEPPPGPRGASHRQPRGPETPRSDTIGSHANALDASVARESSKEKSGAAAPDSVATYIERREASSAVDRRDAGGRGKARGQSSGMGVAQAARDENEGRQGHGQGDGRVDAG